MVACHPTCVARIFGSEKFSRKIECIQSFESQGVCDERTGPTDFMRLRVLLLYSLTPTAKTLCLSLKIDSQAITAANCALRFLCEQLNVDLCSYESVRILSYNEMGL